MRRKVGNRIPKQGVRIDKAPFPPLCLALLSSEELAVAELEGYQRALTLSFPKSIVLFTFPREDKD